MGGFWLKGKCWREIAEGEKKIAEERIAEGRRITEGKING
jgi:hypothetical protein